MAVLAINPWRPTFEPALLAVAALAAWAYLRAAKRGCVPTRFRLRFLGGILLLLLALGSPIETVATHYLLLFHLLQNVMISDWAPPLMILGLTPSMRAALSSRFPCGLQYVTKPMRALPIWLVGWYSIHLAAFYDFALRQSWALNVEHALLIAIGLVFWWPVLSDTPHHIGTLGRLGYLGAAFIASGFLGLALTFAPNPIYEFYAEAPRLWGLSTGRDQNFGGILMTSEQAIVFFAAIGYFVVRLAREEDEATAALDARLTRDRR